MTTEQYASIKAARKTRIDARDAIILRMRKEGQKLIVIAATVHLTRQRVQQLCKGFAKAGLL